MFEKIIIIIHDRMHFAAHCPTRRSRRCAKSLQDANSSIDLHETENYISHTFYYICHAIHGNFYGQVKTMP